MRFSAATVIYTLLATAQAGPLMRIRDDDALEARNLADVLDTLSALGTNGDQAATTIASAVAPQTGEKSNKVAAESAAGAQQASTKKAAAAAGADPATTLQEAADALKQATTAVDQAITNLGTTGNTVGAASVNTTAAGAASNKGGAKGAANAAAGAGKGSAKNGTANAGAQSANGKAGAGKGSAKNGTANAGAQSSAAQSAKTGDGKGAAKNGTANAGAQSSAAQSANGKTGDGKGAAKNGTTNAAAAAGGALTKAAGGAVVAKTADGLLLPDGRIGKNIVAADFNVVTSVFKSAVVKGEGLVFSDIITFPATTPSIFDAAGNTKAFEISINDSSIFTPQGGQPQTQFRRADLLPSIISTAKNSSVSGKRTMHFSIEQDPAKPLALTTNEYQLAFLETADFESRSFDVRVGTGTTGPSLNGKNIVVFGRSGAAIKEMFVAPFSADLQNFAVTLDFDKNTMQVFHSTGTTALAQVSEVVANDNSGGGEYHFALLKLADAQGQQATGINEGMIFSGIFMEDSSDGTVTLQ